MADSLAGDLRQHIYQAHAAGPRRDSRWVMSAEWLNECRKLEDGSGHAVFQLRWTIDAPQTMLGIPIEIRADGGPPHLELDGVTAEETDA